MGYFYPSKPVTVDEDEDGAWLQDISKISLLGHTQC